MQTDAIDVTPDPRILTVLGDIEFSPWQCLAELIDNSFDDFLGSGIVGERPSVTVSLPSKNSDHRSAEVWVSDNGRGMDLSILNNAIRAGWTSNAAHGSLGVFGMGFNIATARLGQRTQVRTTRTGDPYWTVVTLDLPALAAGGKYDVPVSYEPKDDPAQHGTTVIISSLKRERHEALSQNHQQIRNKLGDVYSYLLREHDFDITVSGKSVVPRRPCVWGEHRSVMRDGVEIKAIQPIDVRLDLMKACLVCGKWQSRDHEKCVFCPSGGLLELREQRIWGWIGVQRYLHTSDFGIDFLRNGRKILMRDQRIFDWIDPSGNEDPEKEYPVDNPRNEGRIVGEIHCDHVGVNYQKNAFEYDTVEWRKVVRTIRGEAPLRPKIAERRGFGENKSPLAKLYAGFRTDKPGLKYLLPGDGKTALRDRVTEWVEKFRKGDPDYQSDEVWYQAAKQHDAGTPVPSARPETDVLDEMGLTDPGANGASSSSGTWKPTGATTSGTPATSASGSAASPGPQPLTLEQRLGVYRENSTVMPGIGGRFDAEDLGKVDATVYIVRADQLEDPVGRLVPAFAHMTRAPRLEVFLAGIHKMLTDYGLDLAEFVQVIVAEYVITRASGAKQPMSVVLDRIKARASRDRRITTGALSERSRQLLSRIRDEMLREIKGSPTGYWNLLSPSDQDEAQRRFAVGQASGISWDDVIQTGDFVRHIPAAALVRLIERRPDVFLDGRVFSREHTALTDDTARALAVSRITSLVSELALMADHTPKLHVDELLRVRLSCDLVERELAEAE
ncbi:ATP-binding protein [Catelliglobosispora koreensis]|uniref:ATP-binding protein n=1 Tax=Catelliglobosispora koreensis TaxID=129052 RepID=UPI00036254F4|nr:ATP-binding protein [Catelliglobosispora koreensis]